VNRRRRRKERKKKKEKHIFVDDVVQSLDFFLTQSPSKTASRTTPAPGGETKTDIALPVAAGKFKETCHVQKCPPLSGQKQH